MKLSRYLTVSEVVRGGSGGGDHRVVFGSRRAHTVLVGENEWQLMRHGRHGELRSSLQEELIANAMLVPEDEEELAEVLSENGRDREATDVCYVVVQPSAYCQLGCDYCGQEHLPHNMDERRAELLVRRVRRKLERGEFRQLTIGWFGGEPLLGIKMMRSLTPRLRMVAEEFGCEYSAKIVTNGLRLTPEVVTTLSEELGVRYAEVTLDGLEEQHNRRRPRKNGRDSFDRIFSNVVAAARRDDLALRIGIRCNVDRSNYEDVVPLLDRLVEAGVASRVARFYVAPIHSWGNDADDQSLTPEEFGRWEINWFAALARRGFPLSILPERCTVVCLAAQPHAEVIDAGGVVYQCTEVSQVPTYERGSRRENVHAVARLDDHPDDDRPSPFRTFDATIRAGEVPCHRCELLPVCGGSCPKLWLEGKAACPPMKSNLAERLSLVHLLASRGALPDAEDRPVVCG